MDRRSFLRTSALGGTAAAAATLAAPAYAQGNRTLTLVTSVPDGFAVFDDAAQLAINYITAITDGQLSFNKMPAGSLVGAFEVFDAVSSGQADVYHSAEYYFLNQHPAFAFFTAVPFGMTAQEMANWYYRRGGQELHDNLSSLFGLKPLMCGQTAMQPGGWFNKEINSVDDLQGLRFRMPGQGGQVLGRLGASVQNIPGGEIYQALASNQIDGAEWIGPYADERMGFQEVTKTYYAAGFHEPGSTLSLVFNQQIWESRRRRSRPFARSPARLHMRRAPLCRLLKMVQRSRACSLSACRFASSPQKSGMPSAVRRWKSGMRTWATRSMQRSPTASFRPLLNPRAGTRLQMANSCASATV